MDLNKSATVMSGDSGHIAAVEAPITGTSSLPVDITIVNGTTDASIPTLPLHSLISSPNDSVQATNAATEFVTQVDDYVPTNGLEVKTPVPFVPSLGAWGKPLKIALDLKNPIPEFSLASETTKIKGNVRPTLDILPPELKEDGQLRFPWAAKMDPKVRNLYRTTTPTYLEDGTPMVEIPNHVLVQGLENQKEYLVGQFIRCNTPSGGLIHAVANRIWGKKCKIFTRKLGDSSFLFHIPDESTRTWVLERGLWHIDDCIMFVAPWTPTASLAVPEITSFPVWVTLKNIPSCLYSEWGISWIASGLGAPMLTHKPRLDPTLMGEAKLMVEVELNKPLPQRIAVADKIGNVSIVDVEYSWLPKTCEKCGHLGHKETRCLLLRQPTTLSTVSKGSPLEVVAPVNVVSVPANSTHSFQNAERDNVSTLTCSSPLSEEEPSIPTVIVPGFSLSTALVNANSTPTNLASSKAAPTEASSMVSTPPTMDTLFTPTQRSSLANEIAQGNVSGSNMFASLDSGVDTSFEMCDSSLRTRGGRQIKPTQKVQENQWITVGGHGKRGRGGRGGRG